LQPRKGITLPEDGTELHGASMGPWPCSHGRQAITRAICCRLQASMGPWLCSHGREPLAGSGDHRGLASMGPWLCSHGRPACPPLLWRKIFSLQWGRGFAATEGAGKPIRRTKLQPASMGPWLCSHGRSTWPMGCISDSRRFNGAVALQPRKEIATILKSKCLSASMGPWLCSHGRRPSRPDARSKKSLQWGRGFAATEGSGLASSPTTEDTLQWGRGFAATEGFLDRVDPDFFPIASMGPWLCSHGRRRKPQPRKP